METTGGMNINFITIHPLLSAPAAATQVNISAKFQKSHWMEAVHMM